MGGAGSDLQVVEPAAEEVGRAEVLAVVGRGASPGGRNGRRRWRQERAAALAMGGHGAGGARTTGNNTYAECQILCRVHNIEHSAEFTFAECFTKSPRQKPDTRQN